MPTPTPPTPSATAEASAAAAARDDDDGEEEGNRAARALASIAAQEEAQARPPPPPLAVPPPPPPLASPDNATTIAFLQQLPLAQLQQLAATTTEALSLIQRMLLLGTSPQPTVENSSQRGGTPGSGSAQRSLVQHRRQTTPSSQPESPSGAAELHVRCGGCSSVLAVQVPVMSRMWPSMRVECGGCQQVNHVELPAEAIRAVEQLYADHQQRLQQQTRAAKQLAALTAHQQQYEEQLRASSLLPTTTASTPGQDLVASLPTCASLPAPTEVHEPKRVPSPYNRFIRDMLKHIKMEHARKKTTIGHNEAFALAANMWGSCELNMRAPNYDPLMANAVFKDDDSVDVVVELNCLRAAKQQQQQGMPRTPTTAPECEEKNGEKDDAVCAPTTVAPPQPTVPQMGTTGNPWIRPSSARPPQRQPVAGPAATATDPSALLFQPASTSARDELLTTSMIAQRQAQQHCPSVVVQTMAMVAAGMAER